jgi:hypothetical protein
VELLERLVQSDPSTHAAMSGETGVTARPVAEDAPPSFRGKARTGARDATYAPMKTAPAMDRRPGRLLTWWQDEAEIRQRVAQSTIAR